MKGKCKPAPGGGVRGSKKKGEFHLNTSGQRDDANKELDTVPLAIPHMGNFKRSNTIYAPI
jgi:hypothetical protein